MKQNVRTSGTHNIQRVEQPAFETFALRLKEAFATSDGEYERLSADDIRQRAAAEATGRLRNVAEP